MAGADYLRCAQCGNKAIYDAELNYESAVEWGGLADIAAICKECHDKGYRLAVVQPKERLSQYVASLVYHKEHKQEDKNNGNQD
jgi:hypothetical protein